MVRWGVVVIQRRHSLEGALSRQGEADGDTKGCIFSLRGGAAWQVDMRTVVKPVREPG